MELASRSTDLVAKERAWAEARERVESTLTALPSRVKLNVGGMIFETSKETLLKHKGTFFDALLGSGRWAPEKDTGAFFIDRSPTLFAKVLDYLRGVLPLDVHVMSEDARTALRTELGYYLLPLPAELEAPVLPVWAYLPGGHVIRAVQGNVLSVACFVASSKKQNVYVSDHIASKWSDKTRTSAPTRVVFKVLAGQIKKLGFCHSLVDDYDWEEGEDDHNTYVRGMLFPTTRAGSIIEARHSVTTEEAKIEFHLDGKRVGDLESKIVDGHADGIRAFVELDAPCSVQLLLLE